ncbi:ArgS-related anticodon-binding protein NrtL [Streptomyces sp. NPDC088387]|uniref:ArgS-related anticodon-binding protein NrtL n=1 Tax=Streptomyces sp. NPDC088387 TaxID=3365859 RepID=UPI003801CFB8
MTPVELSRTVLRAVRSAVDDGELSVTVPERAVVTVPGAGGCGDYATNIALQLARPAGQSPRRVAEILSPRLLHSDDRIREVVVTGAGFLNIRLASVSAASAAVVTDVLRVGARYGHVGPSDGPGRGDADSHGRTVHLHAPRDLRALVVMDSVARILRSQGSLVRTSCDAPPPGEWLPLLDGPTGAGAGVGVDGGFRASDSGSDHGDPHPVILRPVPAPADPVPLGRDAARWALLHPAPHDRPRISGEHLVQRESNPLFRVRYVYARTRALARNAADLGFTAEPGDMALPAATGTPAPGAQPTPVPGAPGTNLAPAPGTQSASVPGAQPAPAPGAPGIQPAPGAQSALTPAPAAQPASAPGARPAPATAPGAHPTPGAQPTPVPGAPAPHSAPTPGAQPPPTPDPTPLAEYPAVLRSAAVHHDPSRLARHLVVVADGVVAVLAGVLPRGDEKPSAAHRARLAHVEAVGAVLAGGLSLLGIDAPDHL